MTAVGIPNAKIQINDDNAHTHPWIRDGHFTAPASRLLGEWVSSSSSKSWVSVTFLVAASCDVIFSSTKRIGTLGFKRTKCKTVCKKSAYNFFASRRLLEQIQPISHFADAARKARKWASVKTRRKQLQRDPRRPRDSAMFANVYGPWARLRDFCLAD